MGLRVIDRMYIGGEWARPSGKDTIEILSPKTEEPVVQVVDPTTADVDAAVAAARRAFDDSEWRWLSPQDRACYLEAVRKELERRYPEELAPAFTLQAGVPTTVAKNFSRGALGIFTDAARLATTFPFREPVEGSYKSATLIREPIGVVGAIAPWNGQLYLTLSKLLPALVAGCTVVAKPSPETAIETEILGECFEAAGLPPGVVSIFAGGREAGAALVAHPEVDLVAFTGSTAAGKAVMAAAATRLARVSLELGGKSPGVVLDDVDLEALVPQLLTGTTLQTGQACALLSRVLVPRSRHDEIVEAYVAGLRAVPFGDPDDPANLMGPLVSRAGQQRAFELIESGRREGAQVALGGGRPAEYPKGWFVEPTVLTGVENHMRIAREEVFAPVIAFLAYDEEDEALRIANDTAFGLAGSVFGADLDRAYQASLKIRAGVVTVNGFGLDPGISFGGLKESGIGREGGVEGMRTFTETKALHAPAGFAVPAA